jgi:hypothetical protein
MPTMISHKDQYKESSHSKDELQNDEFMFSKLDLERIRFVVCRPVPHYLGSFRILCLNC